MSHFLFCISAKKVLIASELYESVRAKSPPGRFLYHLGHGSFQEAERDDVMTKICKEAFTSDIFGGTLSSPPISRAPIAGSRKAIDSKPVNKGTNSGGTPSNRIVYSDVKTPIRSNVSSLTHEETMAPVNIVVGPRTPAQNEKVLKTPHPHDVLFGKGGQVISHPGNVHFRGLVHEFKDEYQQVARYVLSLACVHHCGAVRSSSHACSLLPHTGINGTTLWIK